jgi:hypothetical protein
MKTGIVSIIGLLLVLFLVMMLARDGLVGYSSAKTLHEYPYEGFESVQNAFEKRYSEALTPAKKAEHMTPASPVPGPVPLSGAEKAEKEGFAQKDKKGSEGFEPMVQPLKVAGFSGLQSGAYGNEQAIGFMYNNEGSSTCKSYGYTNSKGNICLSDSDIKLLTTRGGNATGPSDQIGAVAK